MLRRPPPIPLLGLLGFLLALVPACGAGRPRVATFDTPVPAAEPRATFAATVDLDAAGDCDERLDLALYEDRAVELVSWDDARGCAGRKIEIRFLSRRTTKEALLLRLRAISRKVQPS